MKKLLTMAIFFFSELYCGNAVTLKTQYTPKNASLNSVLNTLKSVEVASDQRGFATWATLFFSGPCKPKQIVSESDARVSIFFPSLKMGNVDQETVFKSLNKFNVIERLQFRYITKPVTGVLLDIKFVENKAMVKLIHTGDLNKLMIIVYSKNELEKIKQHTSGPIYLAQNNFLSSKKKKNAKFRVMLDPGHGGLKYGAQGFYDLVEKNVNLDIARKVKPILESLGFEVALTRNSDKDVSLDDRCRLAGSFNADMFVSIHANSAGSAEKPNGIETYHVDSSRFVGDGNVASYDFLFVNTKEDKLLARIADNLIRQSGSLSQKFAYSIQTTLINMLKARKLNVSDRGVKKSGFLVLVGLLNKIDMPSALVEVGFITNKEEARKLTSNNYRTLLAQGICRGIRNFLVRG